MYLLYKTIIIRILRTLLPGVLLLLPVISLAQQNSDDSLHFKTYYYEGGAKSSEGYLRNGVPDGYWRSYYRNGKLKSAGNRRNFKLDSLWTFYNRKGEKTVEISYDMGTKQGPRRTYEAGQLVKIEPFEADQIDGTVRYFYPDSSLRKTIPYEDGKQEGMGLAYAEDGRVVSLLTFEAGQLKRRKEVNRYDKQRQKQGLWVQLYPNKNIKVEGTYRNDLKHGYWKYYTAAGDLLRVEKWVNGELQEGASEVSKVDIRREIDQQTGKLKYKGAYREGQKVGVHRWYNDNGKVDSSVTYKDGRVLYEGIVDEKGQKQGPWKYFYPDGTLQAEGRYQNDKKVGRWKYYYRDGSLEQEGAYLLGQADGLWTWYFPDGDIRREEEYLQGLADGASIEYNDSGAVIAEGQYVEGQKDGRWTLIINDHREEGAYLEGRRNGMWRYYYLNNGKLRFKGRYENGAPSGTHEWYYPDGTLKRRGNYQGGKRNGVWEYFSPQGTRELTVTYQEGQEVAINGEKIKQNRP
jgi:antitoxin component YwqK of YwqJK toxin-antitoxin module